MVKPLYSLLAALLVLLAGGCSAPGDRMQVLAGSELKNLDPLLDDFGQ